MKVFIFKKLQGPKKINSKKSRNLPDTSKNNHQKENSKLNLFSLFSQNGQNCFWSVQEKIFLFFNFSSFFALKKVKEYVPPCRRLEKCLNIFSFADFKEKVNIFWCLVTKEKGNIKTWNFGTGVLYQFGTPPFLRECLKNFVAAIIRLDWVVLPGDQVTAVCCICVHSACSTLSPSDQKSSPR